MIYLAFVFWMVLTLFAAAGVYRLWTKLVPAVYVNWALLPGTIISEMAYIFGCLITGGEVRRAKLLPGKGDGGESGGDAAPATEASARWKLLGPVVAGILSIVACVAAVLVVHAALGEPVLREFATGAGVLPASAALPQAPPESWDAFWDQLRGQVDLLRRMAETLADVPWSDWRVPVFIYLALCLSVRLAPVGKPIRPTLLAVVVIAAGIALVGALSARFRDVMENLWPLLTYIWTSLLFVLALTLIVRGVVLLVRAVAGKRSSS